MNSDEKQDLSPTKKAMKRYKKDSFSFPKLKKEAPAQNSTFMLGHNEGSTPLGRFLMWQELFGQ